MAAALVTRLDAFITSWQFPIWEVDFGQGCPVAFQGIVHPVPPYHAVAMPAPSAEQGLYLWLTVPSGLVEHMMWSPVLKTLVPQAQRIH